MSKTSFTTAVCREPRNRMGGALNGAVRCGASCLGTGSRCIMQPRATVELDLNICLLRFSDANCGTHHVTTSSRARNSGTPDHSTLSEDVLVHDRTEDAHD